MMIGEPNRHNPTVSIPPWPLVYDDPTAEIYSPLGSSSSMGSPDGNMIEALTALHRYLPSNDPDLEFDPDPEFSGPDSPVDAFTCDHFRMYEFKIRRCGRGRSHDWTECPYAHPGEKARRRDPRKYKYSGTACPEFRKGSCRKGDGCEFAHGVFECWLHPTRYRTQPCKDGGNCRRRVCFFAHSPDQIRVLPDRVDDSFDGTMLRSCVRSLSFALSPPASPRGDSVSPPVSRSLLSRSLGSGSVNDVVASLRKLHFEKVKSVPSSWNNNQQVGCYSSGFGSPRGSILGPGLQSRPGIGYLDVWKEEEQEMEMVESGRKLRAKMFEKLSIETCLDRIDPDPYTEMGLGDAPDVGWVSDLVDPN